MVFNVATSQGCGRYGYVTTTYDIARLIAVDICNRPVRIRNGFYEFLEFGVGLQPKFNSACCSNLPPGSAAQTSCAQISAAFERDNVATLYDLNTTNPQYVRIYPASAGDAGKRVVVQGADSNGKTIWGIDPNTSSAIQGEVIFLAYPFATSTNQFTGITGILKDQTLEPLTFTQVDVVDTTETALSSMEPAETTASYRRYLINGLPTHCCGQPFGTVQITAQAKLDYIPVQSPQDYLVINNLPALIEEGMALRFSFNDDPTSIQLSELHHRKALQFMFGQLDHIYGKTQTAINVPIWGSNRLTRQPV